MVVAYAPALARSRFFILGLASLTPSQDILVALLTLTLALAILDELAESVRMAENVCGWVRFGCRVW